MKEPAAHRPSLGRLCYLAYHRPIEVLLRSAREGGPWRQRRVEHARREMENAVSQLPPLPCAPAGAPGVTFLTGRRFWHQTAFCFWTLRFHLGQTLSLTLVDDGTWNVECQRACDRLFPGATVVTCAEIEARLDGELPRSRFPALRRHREAYPHLRKLTDVHAGRQGWRLVLDSDMLFFRAPRVLGRWLSQAERPLHMVDTTTAYGYPLDALSALAGGRVPERVNVGVCGLCSERLDWDRLEHWVSTLLQTHGSSYYLEQALVAMLAATEAWDKAPGEDYVAMPSAAEVAKPTAALHHYVAESKQHYYLCGWRHVLAHANPLSP